MATSAPAATFAGFPRDFAQQPQPQAPVSYIGCVLSCTCLPSPSFIKISHLGRSRFHILLNCLFHGMSWHLTFYNLTLILNPALLIHTIQMSPPFWLRRRYPHVLANEVSYSYYNCAIFLACLSCARSFLSRPHYPFPLSIVAVALQQTDQLQARLLANGRPPGQLQQQQLAQQVQLSDDQISQILSLPVDMITDIKPLPQRDKPASSSSPTSTSNCDTVPTSSSEAVRSEGVAVKVRPLFSYLPRTNERKSKRSHTVEGLEGTPGRKEENLLCAFLRHRSFFFVHVSDLAVP